MGSCLLTLIFYVAGVGLVMKRCAALSTRLLGIGALPAAWISVCALAGLLATLLGLPPLISLGSFVLTLIVFTLKTTKVTASPHQIQFKWCSWLALGISGSCAIAIAIFAHSVEPWGGWDTLFTWIMRARFFSIGGAQWSNTFSNDLALLHPDYPPMLSWALHALWRIDGQTSSFAVHTLFDPFCLGLVCFVFGFQAIPAERIRLDLSTAILLAMPLLWRLAAMILADVVLAYTILGSCAFYALGTSKQDRRAIAVSSFLAAWSGLIKNEGAVWFIAFMTVAVAVSLRSPMTFRGPMRRGLIAGAAIPLAALAAFKLLLAPPSDLSDPLRCFEISNLVQPGLLINPERLIVRLDQAELFIYHRVIWQQVWQVLFDWKDWGLALWWCLYLLVRQIRPPRRLSPLLISIGIQAAIYYGVYLTTPYLPFWHITNSMSRIMMHLVPAALCLLAFDTSPSAVPNRRSKQVAVPEFSAPGWIAAAYLISASIFSLVGSFQGQWNLGKLPPLNAEEFAALELPGEPVMSYVTTDLGTRDFYSTQFAVVPTVLVIDRREPTLLARFPDEAQLRRYCEKHHWELKRNRGGLGWAQDKGGKELRQPVEVPRAW